MKTRDILIWILAIVILLFTLHVLVGCGTTKNPKLYKEDGTPRVRNEKVGME
jgi:hypothetical protein